jgi:hypothetical protein
MTQFQIVSYSRAKGFGDLDAPLGLCSDGLPVWLRGSYALPSIKTFPTREDAARYASGLAPHVQGGRVAVIPAAPMPEA